MEDIRTRLKAAWYYRTRIDANLDKIKELESLAASMTAHFSAAAGDGSGAKSPIENPVAQILELKEEVEQQTTNMRAELKAIEALIDTLPDYRLRMILVLRFLYFYRWAEIAYRMHYETSYTIKLCGRAIRILESGHRKTP